MNHRTLLTPRVTAMLAVLAVASVTAGPQTVAAGAGAQFSNSAPPMAAPAIPSASSPRTTIAARSNDRSDSGKNGRSGHKTTPSAKRSVPRPRVYAGFASISSGGFGDSQNAYAWAMAWFKGKLYVGTSRDNMCGSKIVTNDPGVQRITGCPANAFVPSLDLRAQIWVYTPETRSWQMVYQSPMVNTSFNGHVIRLARDVGYRSMAVYTDRHGVTALYVGTTAEGTSAYLLRTVDGTHFQALPDAGFGGNATSIRAITAFNGRIFIAPFGVGAYYYNGRSRDKVLVTDDPAAGHWSDASTTGFGDALNTQLYSMIAFNGQLYAAISNITGFQVWRTNAQGRAPYKWTAVVVNGGYRGSTSPTVTAMVVFHNKLYVGSAANTIGPDNKPAKGAELLAINPDDSWDLIMGDARETPEGFKMPLSGHSAGFGNRYAVYLWTLAAHDGWLYAGTYDWSSFILGDHPRGAAARIAGFDLWRSHDGVHWSVLSTSGFGNPYAYGVRTMLDTPAGLFLGTANPFAAAPDRQGGTDIWLLADPLGMTEPHGVTLSAAPCPMAHCSAHLNGNENITLAGSSAAPAWQYRQPGVIFSLGLGCSAGTRLIVCAGTTDASHFRLDSAYVYALDLQGHLLWDSRTILNAYAVGSVPLLDNQDNSYVADTNWILSVSPNGVVRWQIPNPAHASFVSFNMLPSGYLVGQAGIGFSNSQSLLVVINPETGQMMGSLDLGGTENGFAGDYGTANTVSVVGNRIYTVTQFQPFSRNGADPRHHGRLYAVDVDAHGQLHVAWSWPFEGPSGASPLTIPGPHTRIYFDGTGVNPGDPQHVMLFALQDMGTTPQLLWANDLTKIYGIPYPTNSIAPGIQAAPAHDPRGGLWVYASYDSHVFHFDEATGRLLDAVSIPTLTNDPGAVPSGTIEIATNGGRPIMLVGVLAGPQHANGVAAIDLTTNTLVWSAPLGTGSSTGTFGQFVLAPTPDGNTVLAVPSYQGTLTGYTLS